MFASRLKELRINKGISQLGLAEILGMSQQAIGKWETGKATPDYENLKKLASFFNVSTDYLLGNNPTNPPKMDNDNILDEDVKMLARNKMKDMLPEEREKKKKQLNKIIEMMFE